MPRDDPDQKATIPSEASTNLMVSDETSSSAKFFPIGFIDAGFEAAGIGGGDGVGINASGATADNGRRWFEAINKVSDKIEARIIPAADDGGSWIKSPFQRWTRADPPWAKAPTSCRVAWVTVVDPIRGLCMHNTSRGLVLTFMNETRMIHGLGMESTPVFPVNTLKPECSCSLYLRPSSFRAVG